MAPGVETLSARKAGPGSIAHYGCSAGGGRLVRCELAGGVTKAPEAEVVSCPACGNRHLVQFLWRSRSERDEGVAPEVLVGDEDGEH